MYVLVIHFHNVNVPVATMVIFKVFVTQEQLNQPAPSSLLLMKSFKMEELLHDAYKTQRNFNEIVDKTTAGCE